ncbi:unnamed protein product [Protopolystoma xenopodis]|uniref:Uncharacterized protein n=1 Tax=Protopolystoma xenopodis TaxID=117903 RepID=A0A3S5C6L0_9PLAT|nr:unnamed protein product [Protopolystoma xenopodis]
MSSLSTPRLDSTAVQRDLNPLLSRAMHHFDTYDITCREAQVHELIASSARAGLGSSSVRPLSANTDSQHRQLHLTRTSDVQTSRVGQPWSERIASSRQKWRQLDCAEKRQTVQPQSYRSTCSTSTQTTATAARVASSFLFGQVACLQPSWRPPLRLGPALVWAEIDNANVTAPCGCASFASAQQSIVSNALPTLVCPRNPTSFSPSPFRFACVGLAQFPVCMRGRPTERLWSVDVSVPLALHLPVCAAACRRRQIAGAGSIGAANRLSDLTSTSSLALSLSGSFARTA